MSRSYCWKVGATAMALTMLLASASVAGNVLVFQLHDHPNGTQNPPSYGLRLDNILDGGVYTFSFDYADVTGMADVELEFDENAGTIRISGRAYGGRDTGSDWDATEQGWVDIDFTYRTNVIFADDTSGAPGDDIYVLDDDASNNGTLTQDGWGGNQTVDLSDKTRDDYSFQFDNDDDSKGNPAIANDPNIWSGAGWLMPDASGAQDWLFIGELEMGVPTETTSWGSLKTRF